MDANDEGGAENFVDVGCFITRLLSLPFYALLEALATTLAHECSIVCMQSSVFRKRHNRKQGRNLLHPSERFPRWYHESRSVTALRSFGLWRERKCHSSSID